MWQKIKAWFSKAVGLIKRTWTRVKEWFQRRHADGTLWKITKFVGITGVVLLVAALIASGVVATAPVIAAASVISMVVALAQQVCEV